MLVGEESHRGAHKVAAWLPSVATSSIYQIPVQKRLLASQEPITTR